MPKGKGYGMGGDMTREGENELNKGISKSEVMPGTRGKDRQPIDNIKTDNADQSSFKRKS